jgi:hypothetical protein
MCEAERYCLPQYVSGNKKGIPRPDKRAGRLSRMEL